MFSLTTNYNLQKTTLDAAKKRENLNYISKFELLISIISYIDF